MSKYTTSYSGKRGRQTAGRKKAAGKRPRYRKAGAGRLSGGARRQSKRRGQKYLGHSQGFGRKKGAHDARRPYAFIAVGCAFLLFLAALIGYINRDVEITLNGSEAKVRIHSTISEIITDQELSLKAGNLLAVDDSVLEKYAGDSCSVTVDGEVVDVADIDTVEVTGGEVVTIEDGADVYEEHDIVATEIEPTITVNGSGAVRYVKQWGIPGRSEVWTGKISGITYDRGVVQEVQDCIIQCSSVVPDDDDAKYIALTFDEAPSEHTEEILEILAEYGVTATFFLLGDATEEYADAAAAIVAAGCEIGSNSYDSTTLSTLSGDDLRSQLTSGFDAIEAATGTTTYLLRPLSSAWSEQNWCDAMDLVSAVITYNLASGDWLLQGADTVVENVLGAATNGDIVLLTDSDAMGTQTVEALPQIIEGLLEDGFTLVTVSELIATDAELAEAVDLAAVSMPDDAVLPTVSEDSEE